MPEQRVALVQSPRADDVAGAEQLGADGVRDEHLAREHALEDEQADVVGARAGEPQSLPRPFREGVHHDLELALGRSQPLTLEQLAELGIELQDLRKLSCRHVLVYGD